jgi:hypothetical protein
MADFLLLVLVSLSFMVVSIALAARYGVEALIIWDNDKKGDVQVTTPFDDDLEEEEEDNHPY